MKRFIVTLLFLCSALFAETINGHELPPEPQNPDATLLGVDKNNNGVRDEVERWIYKEMPTYHHPEIERVIAMQDAKAYQMSLKDPNNTNNDVLRSMDRAGYCLDYYIDSRNIPFTYWKEYKAKLKDKQFNTKERLETYFDFNYGLKGQVFTLKDSSSDQCDINIDTMP
jgi:hypothetical protein